MWAIARYDLHLTGEEFYRLTPRQYYLLVEAHRRRLAHLEMIQAQTTAAIINYSFSPPETAVKPSDLCFNFRPPKSAAVSKPVRKYTEGEIVDWQARVANLTSELKRGGGPMLDEIRSKSDG
jgi:hypothetical protein